MDVLTYVQMYLRMWQSHLGMLVMLSRFPEGIRKWEEGGGRERGSKWGWRKRREEEPQGEGR